MKIGEDCDPQRSLHRQLNVIRSSCQVDSPVRARTPTGSTQAPHNDRRRDPAPVLRFDRIRDVLCLRATFRAGRLIHLVPDQDAVRLLQQQRSDDERERATAIG